MPTMAQLRLQQVRGILRDVRNPLPILLDWVRLKRKPYVARTRTGIAIELRPGRGDWFSFYENLIDRQYLRLGQRVCAGDNVIDVGANIGCFSALAASLVGPSGKVVAAEPAASTYRQLVANLERGRLSNAVTFQVAVGGRAGTAQIRSSSNSLYSSIYPQVGGHNVDGTIESVPLVTIEQLMRESDLSRCALLKMDCEGAEYDVVESMSHDTAMRIDQIVMELHDIPGRSPHALLDQLRTLGYSISAGTIVYAWRQV